VKQESGIERITVQILESREDNELLYTGYVFSTLDFCGVLDVLYETEPNENREIVWYQLG